MELPPPPDEVRGEAHLQHGLPVDVPEPSNESESELSGLALFEARYGLEPPRLARNVALLLVIGLQRTHQTLVIGRDSTLLDEPCQKVLDETLKAIGQSEEPAYEMLAQKFLGDPREANFDMLAAWLSVFTYKKQHYLARFDDMSENERWSARQDIMRDLFDLIFFAESYVDQDLDSAQMIHEGGETDWYDAELYREFVLPYFEKPIHGRSLSPGERSGLSGQVRRRLIFEARHLHMQSREAGLSQ